MDNYSFLGNAEIGTIEEMYASYLEDEKSVDESWRLFFQGYEFARTDYEEGFKSPEMLDKEFRVINLIHGYRQRGHLFTKTNPVRTRRKYTPTLDLENYRLSEQDLETVFQAGNRIGIGPSTLREILDHLKQTYCHSIGVEYQYILNPDIREKLQKRMEKLKNTPNFTLEEKKEIFNHLKEAVGFETFIQKKFVGQKRFSLEGAEALIPALDAIIEKGAELGIEEFVIGMSHRGRLNLLANVLKKPYEDILNEFIGKKYDGHISLGDVKYHLGFRNKVQTDKGREIILNLLPNPSHLEAVGSIVQGIARAKIYHTYGKNFKKLAPIIIHGDAAIAAQGVVYELVQMAQLKGYKTGGTIHLVINNQVGFTTNYLDARSSTYCTDIAKVTKSPVFHVNGDDVEALVYTIQLAMEFRESFNSDVFIDILCFRRHGHNEGDEPRFTQPLLYKAISKHPNVRDLYGKSLVEQGVYKQNEIEKEILNFNNLLEDKLLKAKEIDKVHIEQFLKEDWKKFRHVEDKDFKASPDTGVDKKTLISLFEKMHTLPDDHNFFKKITKIFEDRKKMVKNDKLDWAICELLAYATLLKEGKPVRSSGQDSERGTFSHRHASLALEGSEEKYIPLKHVDKNQGTFHVFNSPLSEYGVLGFEYGYAMAVPEGLTIWEAQFGDFYNVAQPIVDQFISSADEKWGLMNGLVLYLPHGFEGQGPEHSSARIERFLNVAARNNIQVVNCTTPANFFHVLRRQLHRDFRIPLIIFTPKSLLRHPDCISTINDLSNDRFHEVIDDNDVIVNDVKRVVYCSGKIYYDLLEVKRSLEAKDVALVRVEQLHPFPLEQLNKIRARYKNTLLSLWVQEEPENMGPWLYINHNFKEADLEPVTRIPSGSPAVGLTQLHNLGQEEIIYKVFRKCTCERKYKYCGLQCVEGKSREEILKQHRYL